MVQGTTPTHTFALPIDAAIMSSVRITYAQHGKVLLTKEKADCSIEGNAVTVKLAQEDTLLFKENSSVQIQVRVLTTGGDALASDIIKVPCAAVLDKAVLE